MKTTDREKLLGEALRAVLVAVGVLSVDASPTGPELLVAAENYVRTGVVSMEKEG